MNWVLYDENKLKNLLVLLLQFFGHNLLEEFFNNQHSIRSWHNIFIYEKNHVKQESFEKKLFFVCYSVFSFLNSSSCLLLQPRFTHICFNGLLVSIICLPFVAYIFPWFVMTESSAPWFLSTSSWS